MGKIEINGQVINGNMTIKNGEMYVNDVKVVDMTDEKVVNITIHGDIHGNVDLRQCKNLTTHTVNGNVFNSQGNITCADVTGDVETRMGDITCKDVTGNVTNKMGNVTCANVGGQVVSKMGNVHYNKVNEPTEDTIRQPKEPMRTIYEN